MHVNVKGVAIAGMLAAFSAVLMVLSTVLEMSSLFFIAAASFCIGIVIREWGLRFGLGFFIAISLLALWITPNRLYGFTLIGMGVYLWLSEFLWERLAASTTVKNRTLVLWLGKYLVFNCLYLPVLLFFQELLFVKALNSVWWIVAFLAGQIFLLIYDMAYRYFQGRIWGKLRVKLIKG